MDCQGRGTGRFTVALLVAVVWGRVCAADLDDSRIVPIADILTAGSADPPAFGKRVKIRGTVTWCDSRALVVEDDSASI